ncbi:MAG: hypothetical protein V4732_20790 [Pseudomonadota bacterium]
MDNFSSPTYATLNKINTPPTVIVLNAFQHTQYQSDSIEIHSPDGEHLETFGENIRREQAEDLAYQLQNQICLLECLLLNIHENIELPAKAVAGLVDVFYRMQDFCSTHIK